MENLVRFSKNRRRDLARMECDVMEMAMAKKVFLDTVRYRAFKHYPCCKLFLDFINLQISFRVEEQTDLVGLLDDYLKFSPS